MTPLPRYREITGSDRSRLAEQVSAQRERVAARLAAVRRVAVVMSGKGGVGKSYVTAGLALAAAVRFPSAAGVLDADLHGPTVARLLGAGGPLRVRGDAVEPAVGLHGVRVFSTDLLLEEHQPMRWREPPSERFVWRGTLEAGALREFLSDVAWGPLELLLVDLPPGIAHLQDLAELVPTLAGAVVVTLPSDESLRAVSRAMEAARASGVAMLGVIENMSGYACADCGAAGPLFPGDAGARLAQRFGVPLLGRVPFTPASRVASAISSPAAASAAAAASSTRREFLMPLLPSGVVTRALEVLVP